MTCIPIREAAPSRTSRWWSPPGTYFLTVCSNRRKPGLATPQFNSEFHAATHLLALERQWQVRTAVVMPHHVHLLVTLGKYTELHEVVQSFKDRLVPCLQRFGLGWDRGFYSRQLLPGNDALPAFLYIFQNPHRAQLIAEDETWPGYYCAEGDWSWFAPLVSTDCHFPAWLVEWRLYGVRPAPE